MNAIGSESVPVFVNIRGVAQICTDIHTDASAYVVTFKDWDGTVLKTEAVVAGGNATPPTHPTRTGYNSNGWTGSYTNVTSDRTVTAAYTIKTFTVTFNYYSGSSPKTVTRTVNYGGNATPPTDYARDGYTWNGWSGSYTNVTSNRTITGQYTAIEPDTFTATFVNDDGTTVLYTTSVTSGGYATYAGSTPTNELQPTNPESGKTYSFSGWSPDPSSTPITSNCTFVAQYSGIIEAKYPVRFFRNGSRTDELASFELPWGSKDYSCTAPSIDGWTFNGWSKISSTGSNYGQPVAGSVDYAPVYTKTVSASATAGSGNNDQGNAQLFAVPADIMNKQYLLELTSASGSITHEASPDHTAVLLLYAYSYGKSSSSNYIASFIKSISNATMTFSFDGSSLTKQWNHWDEGDDVASRTAFGRMSDVGRVLVALTLTKYGSCSVQWSLTSTSITFKLS